MNRLASSAPCLTVTAGWDHELDIRRPPFELSNPVWSVDLDTTIR